MSTHLEETVFLAARELSDPAAREAFLLEACGGDEKLRAAINARIDETPTVLATTVAENGPTIGGEKVGESIGRYKLLRQIGEGGFGIVYQAEQSEPVRRMVALKVIKVGMDTKNVIARFEAERQALAIMDHPNIAGVLDAGTTATGRPYFVMDLVQGIAVTKYCDENHLGARERLTLFISICHAIQHAHQKGIIHRDIKPSNILVATHDGVPVPKVIDFGIAKATETRLTELTFFTEMHAFVGTPAYMSPEQADTSGVDIDTRADIYSLGVLLYEMLAGRLPFEPKDLLKAGIDEIRRTIREVEPPRPSTRLKMLTVAERQSIADQRQLAPEQLAAMLRGDLDWIVMKTLEKDRARRYDTANGLATDLRRFLDNKPVSARPPSRVYLFGKLVRRHRTAFAAASAVFLALILGTAVSVWQAFRATFAERVASEELYSASMILAQAAWEESDISRLRGLLDETRSFPNRGFEWYYWELQTHLERRTLRGHTEGIAAAAYSPDGTKIVTGSEDKTVRIWDAESGHELKMLVGHSAPVTGVAFSPDGRRILTGSKDHSARVWDAESGRELLSVNEHSKSVNAVSYFPDGERFFTGSSDRWAKIWNAGTGRELRTFRELNGIVGVAAISPDGRRVAIGRDEMAGLVWDAETGKPLWTLSQENEGVTSAVAWFPNGARLLTGNREGSVRIVDSKTGDEILTFEAHQEAIASVAVSSDNHQLLTGSSDKTAILWELSIPKKSEDDADAAAKEEAAVELRNFKGHDSKVSAVAFSPDQHSILTASDDTTAKIWDIRSNRSGLVFSGHHDGVTSSVFTSDGRTVVTGSRDRTVRIWDVADGKVIATIEEDDSLINALAVSPDGQRIVTGSKDKTAKVWDVKTGGHLLTLSGHTRSVRAVAFSPDGRRITTGSLDRTVKVWDADSGNEVATIAGHTDGVVAVAYSADSRWIATGSLDQTARIWMAETGAEIGTLRGHFGEVTAVAFSAGMRQLLTASADKSARLWEIKTGRVILQLKRHDSAVAAVGFSPDGRRILTGSADRTAKLWDSRNGRELLTLKGHTGTIASVSFSPRGTEILTGSLDGTARLWMSASPEEVANWQKDEAAATRASPGNQESGTSSSSDRIRRGRPREVSDTQLDDVLDDLAASAASGKWIDAADRLATAERMAGADELDLVERYASQANAAAREKNARILDVFARILFRQGKLTEAVKAEEQAIAVADSKVKAEFQKSLASYLLGRLPEED